jgi:putative SOS response-associated peptidase YedK
VRTCTIITTDANAAMAPLHHRMPVILGRADVDRWLGEGGTALLRPAPEDWLRHWPVSTRVNSVKNDAPDLVEAAATNILL